MISALTVENFRGLRKLEVQGLGRVNLIIGRNDCGKTALMEALLLAKHVDHVASVMLLFHYVSKPGGTVLDFERHWRSLFHEQNALRGFSVSARMTGGEEVGASVRLGDAPSEILTEEASPTALFRRPWAIDVKVTKDKREDHEQIVATAGGLKLPPSNGSARSHWITPSHDLSSSDIGRFSRLRQMGQDAQLFDMLRGIDDHVTGVDILSPDGTDAELYVRHGAGTPLLPLSAMGDGFRRCLEIGLAASGEDVPALFIDEIDNGLHHSVLEPVWRWLAAISRKRDLQIFATTHSEECIQAACQAFTTLDDDGLRVIRLDRREDRTTAAVYDRALVEAALRTDVEIRG